MSRKFTVTKNDSVSTINYLANVSTNKDFNFSILKWNNSVVLRNCDANGQLISLNKPSNVDPWLLLTMKPFVNKDEIYPVFACSSCSPSILRMSLEQEPSGFAPLTCAHSKVVSSLFPNSLEKFEVSNSVKNVKASYKSLGNDEVAPIHSLESTGSDRQNLISVFIDGEVSLIYTVGKQTIPRCSRCNSKNC